MLLLGAATANLHWIGELAQCRTVEQAAENQTVPLIAHRPYTATLFHDGRFPGHGAHEEPMEPNDISHESAVTQLASAR
ncbi:hypothetical protein ACFV7Q_36350 [Streptomyces sp. NPDC059851]|uniref:hypothetical protein n=1 Tax=Streptomyces sp. NPDC059851 TaxID=3346971 RepID=UPI00364FDA9C